MRDIVTNNFAFWYESNKRKMQYYFIKYYGKYKVRDCIFWKIYVIRISGVHIEI